jgi:hypothetical protein
VSPRLTNLVLLAALAGAFLTGWVAFGLGTGWVRVPLAVHAVLGLTIVALIPWKSVIMRSGLEHNRGAATMSLALLVAVTLTISTGVLFAVAGVRSYGPLTAMQVHVGSGTLALLLVIVHGVQRPVRLQAVDLERRNLLRAGSVLGIAGVAYLGLAGAARALRLPGQERRTSGSYALGSGDPAAMPVTSWLNDGPPSIDPRVWELRVGNTWLALEDLTAFTDEVTAILDCTGGWFSEQTWRGVRLERLIEGTEGRSVVVRSATGYQRRFPRSDAPHLLLATHLGGEPLSRGHGFPVRLVAPGRRGFWWVKWVEAIEVSDRSWWLQPPFPLT